MTHYVLVQFGACIATAFLASSAVPATTTYSHAELASHEQTRVFLARLGVNAQSACAAGVSSQEASALFESAADTLDALRPSLEANDANLAAARATLAALRIQVATAPDSSLAAAIQQAEEAVQAAMTARELLDASAFESVAASLPQGTKNGLAAIRTNKGRNLPVEYKLVSRTDEEWKTIQEARRHTKACSACSLEAEPSQQSVISDIETDPTVAVGRGRLQASIAQISAVWFPETE